MILFKDTDRDNYIVIKGIIKMALAKLELPNELLNELLNEKIKVFVPKGRENEVDYEVRQELLIHFESKEIVKFNNTGIKLIDQHIPSVKGNSEGELDVLIFNKFNNNIDLIIENKQVKSKKDPLEQAIMYANGLNLSKTVDCRVVIGHIPGIEVRVLVGKEWKELFVNGKKVNYFLGPKMLKLIYDNPEINEFKLEELIEKPFTQKDFHNIINKLKTLYRQIPEIQNNDDLSINFTVSFVALKMVLEKQSKIWSSYTRPRYIEDEVENIIGDMADPILKEKYYDIFVIKNKDNVETFNFKRVLHGIVVSEHKDGIPDIESIVMKIHTELNRIPDKDLSIDLFGEVYECLASKKTKSSLGEFFTRRHIIQPIVRMFLTDDDIENIITNKKVVGDICCGTGGFLTESFKHIKKECEENYPELDTSVLASEIIVGYDINHNNIGRTRINMTLAGDGFSDIQRLNSLTSTLMRNTFDYILTNIPYGKGDFAITDPNSEHEFIRNNNNKRLELNFLVKIVSLLKPGGKAAIIVPEGILEAPTLANIREFMLMNCKIDTIISLPKFSFAPYTKWKTYVIFIEKRRKALQTLEDPKLSSERIYMYIVDNDGYANSDKRFPTNLKDENGAYLHNELSPYIDNIGIKYPSRIEQIYELKANDTTHYHLNEWGNEIPGDKYGYVNLKSILDKKTVKYPKLSISKVKIKLWDELQNTELLNKEDYKTLSNLARIDKKGKYKKFIKDDFIKDNELVEGLDVIFEQLDIMYDPEEDKFYDLLQEETRYALTLVPEKYLRVKDIPNITIDVLEEKFNTIKSSFIKDIVNLNSNLIKHIIDENSEVIVSEGEKIEN